jgi:tRNA pseudouridine(55) synthase
MELPPYAVLEKAVGETPLSCMESWRLMQNAEYFHVPLTYAGRLDPMASGKLLVLIGEECKQKEGYLALDKTYEFSVLLGIGSDTHDVLGRLHTDKPSTSSTRQGLVLGGDDLQDLEEQLRAICVRLTGDVELPYPHFSAKTVQGKPLHMWTLEGRLDEIEIPTKSSTIYSLQLDKIETSTRQGLVLVARDKIDTIAEVTDDKKSLGKDFRRVDVRQDWEQIKQDDTLPAHYQIAHFTCTASSGTYMRTLAKLIGQQLTEPTSSLAWSIHRTQIGEFDTRTQNWSKVLN